MFFEKQDRKSILLNEAADECLGHIQQYFDNHPPPTGIQSHDFRDSDTVITTFPKSGTTLTQYMSYQIVCLSGGGPDFDPTGLEFPDLSVVSPWIEYIPAIGIPPCETKPRILKTHFPIRSFDGKICKHVLVVRNPIAFPASWLDFNFNAIVPDAASVDEEVREAAFHACVKKDLLTPVDERGFGKWHAFMLDSFYAVKKPNVFVMFYEDVVADMKQAVRSLAKFLDRELSEENVTEVVKRCDRKKMARDPRFTCSIENKAFGLNSNLTRKAQEARVDGFKKFKFTEDELKQLEDMNLKAFGVKSFSELKESIKRKIDMSD